MKNFKYLLFALSILFLSSFCVDNTFCAFPSTGVPSYADAISDSQYYYYTNSGNYIYVLLSHVDDVHYTYYMIDNFNGSARLAFYFSTPTNSGYDFNAGNNIPYASYSSSGSHSLNSAAYGYFSGFGGHNVIYSDLKHYATFQDLVADNPQHGNTGPEYSYNDTFDDFKLSVIGLNVSLPFNNYSMAYDVYITYPSLLTGTKYDFFELGVKGSKGEQIYKINSGDQHHFIDCHDFCLPGEKVYIKCTGFKGTEYGRTVCAIIDTALTGFTIFTGTPTKPAFVVNPSDTPPESDLPSNIINNNETVTIFARGNTSYSYSVINDYIYYIDSSNTSYTEETYVVNNVTSKGNEVTETIINNIYNNTYNTTYIYNYGDSDIDIPEFKNQFQTYFDDVFSNIFSYLGLLSDYGIPQPFIITLVGGLGLISIAIIIKVIVIVISAIL